MDGALFNTWEISIAGFLFDWLMHKEIDYNMQIITKKTSIQNLDNNKDFKNSDAVSNNHTHAMLLNNRKIIFAYKIIQFFCIFTSF